MNLLTILSGLSAIFAFGAGFLWFKSSLVKIPNSIHFFSVMVSGGIGAGQSQDLQILAKALIKQSQYSARAAICACIAAVLQAASLAFQILPN